MSETTTTYTTEDALRLCREKCRGGMWAYVPSGTGVVVGRGETGTMLGDEIIPATIALANAALPDSDPRKITWEKMDALRITLLNEGSAFGSGRLLVEQLADALESYLPPQRLPESPAGESR